MNDQKRCSRSALVLAAAIELPALCLVHSGSFNTQRPDEASVTALASYYSSGKPLRPFESISVCYCLHQPVSGLSNKATTERNWLFNSCWKPHSALLSGVGSSSSKQRAGRAGAAKRKKVSTWNHSLVLPRLTRHEY